MQRPSPCSLFGFQRLAAFSTNAAVTQMEYDITESFEMAKNKHKQIQME